MFQSIFITFVFIFTLFNTQQVNAAVIEARSKPITGPIVAYGNTADPLSLSQTFSNNADRNRLLFTSLSLSAWNRK